MAKKEVAVSDLFVTISETDTEKVSAMKTDKGVLIKSITTGKNGQSESLVHLDGGVLVNHGSEETPDWRLNR